MCFFLLSFFGSKHHLLTVYGNCLVKRGLQFSASASYLRYTELNFKKNKNKRSYNFISPEYWKTTGNVTVLVSMPPTPKKVWKSIFLILFFAVDKNN